MIGRYGAKRPLARASRDAEPPNGDGMAGFMNPGRSEPLRRPKTAAGGSDARNRTILLIGLPQSTGMIFAN